MRETLDHVPAANGGDPIACHILEPPSTATATALLIHGRDGAGLAPHMRAIADAYLTRGWRVVAPDLPRSRATLSAGPPETITMRIHHTEAGAVLDWVRSTYGTGNADRRLAIAGHSLGAYAIARLGAQSDDLDHLLAVSPVLSGNALLEARRAMGPVAIEALRREAPDMLAEMTAHDSAPSLRQITAPLAVMTGAEDGLTPPSAARAYFDAAPGGRFYAAMPGQHHCPSGPIYARALAAALDALGT